MKLALVFGGPEPEHAISLISAFSVYQHIKPLYEITLIAIDPQGDWFLLDPLSHNQNSFVLKKKQSLILKTDGLYTSPTSDECLKFDLAFPLVHGFLGEDGTLQTQLIQWNIPYIGCSPLAHYIGFNKHFFKQFCQTFRFPILSYHTLSRKDLLADTFSWDTLNFPFPYPLIVKPSQGGSSVGISIAYQRTDLKKSVELALEIDKICVIEPYHAEKYELECAITGPNTNPTVHPVGEILIEGVYSYTKKYQTPVQTKVYPKEHPYNTSIEPIAKKLYQTLGFCDLARLDFLLVDGQLYINEINTVPGFTTISLFPLMCQAGWNCSYQKVLSRLFDESLIRQ